MSSGQSHQQIISGTSAANGGQAFAGTVHGNVYYGSSADDPLKALPFAEDATFNALKRQHERACLADTRVELLKEIYNWAEGHDEHCIFWLNGLAGTGKSTIARTFSRWCYEQRRLGASFFFSRGGRDVGHAGKFVSTIALQLGESIPAFQEHIRDSVREHKAITSQSLRDQWENLILGPLSKLDGRSSVYILIIDALDECQNEDDIRLIIQLLSETRTLGKVRLRIFLTSRPEVPIRHGFCEIPNEKHRGFILNHVPLAAISHDISVFFNHELTDIARKLGLETGWPGADVITLLSQKANGLFIWAATACRFIGEGKVLAMDRLSKILGTATVDESSEEDSSTDEAPTKEPREVTPDRHLDTLYLKVLALSTQSFKGREREKLCTRLRSILGTMVVLFSPLSGAPISRLLSIEESIIPYLSDLHSIVDIPNDQDQPLSLHHPSFRDFLLNSNRCTDLNLYVDKAKAHQLLADKCILLMSTAFMENVCSIGRPGALVAICDTSQPGKLVTEVDSNDVNQHLPSEMQYACLYWAQHLEESGDPLHDDGQEHKFLQVHLLHWLEALSWMGRVSEGIYAITKLELMTTVHDCPHLSAFVYDIKRFVLNCRQAIENAPLQTYCSALIFSPESSIVRNRFKKCAARWVQTLPVTKNKGNACLQTLEGHSRGVKSVAFSHNSTRLASAEFGGIVKIWEASSGACLKTLIHSGYVNSLAFSHDSTRLASASRHGTVKIWDASSGACLQTLRGHSGDFNSNYVDSVAFSHDSTRLASASDDGTVKIWDISSGAYLRTLIQSGFVNAVAFSHDSTRLVSASKHGIVKVWDTSSGACLQILKSSSNFGNLVAFSHDSTRLASVLDSGRVKIWDASSSDCVMTLKGHGGAINSIAFSHDSTRLASGLRNTTVQIWSTSSGNCVGTLKGHSSGINSVAFSYDSKRLASASSDYTVKIWNTSGDDCVGKFERHSDWVRSVAFSHDSTRLASASDDCTVKIWDASSGDCVATLEGHSGGINSVAFSHDSTRLASASYDRRIKVWDASSGDCVATLKGHIHNVNSIAFSHDSTRLASASRDFTVKIWDVSSGYCVNTLEGHRSYVNSVAFTHDSTRLASGSSDGTTKIWDARSGDCVATLKDYYIGPIYLVAFSRDSKWLASASSDDRAIVWNANSGICQQKLSIGNVLPSDHMVSNNRVFCNISFNSTHSVLQTGIGAVTIDARSTPKITSEKVEPQGLQYYGVALSSSKEWISYNSKNLIWIPPEYRPLCLAISGNKVCFGLTSGRVWMCSIQADAVKHY